MPARSQALSHLLMHSAKRAGIRVLFYHAGDLAQISTAISGTAELLRLSDFGDVYMKYNLALHKNRMFLKFSGI